MTVIKENIANLVFICVGLGWVTLSFTVLNVSSFRTPASEISLFIGAIIVGIFLYRWVSGSQGEPLTSLPRVGNYKLRHALFYEGDREKGEEPHYEFIVLINGKRRFLELPERSVQETLTENAGNPGRLVHQLIVGETEYVLETECVTGYSEGRK